MSSSMTGADSPVYVRTFACLTPSRPAWRASQTNDAGAVAVARRYTPPGGRQWARRISIGFYPIAGLLTIRNGCAVRRPESDRFPINEEVWENGRSGDEGDPTMSEPNPGQGVKELDLTDEPSPGAEPASPREVPVEVQVAREGMRGRIAIGLLLVIAGAVTGAFAATALDWAAPPDLKDLLTQVYNPLVGLFGAVIGFYFGSMNSQADTVRTRPKMRR